MKHIVTLAVALAMMTMAVPVTAGEDVRELNREWILEQNPGYTPGEIVEVHHNGIVEEMTAEDALEITLDRAGDKLLPKLVSAEAHGTAELVGDIWVLGFGTVTCGTTTTVAPNPVGFVPVDPQLWIYPGDIGYNTGSSASFWSATSFTMKDGAAGTGAINYGGISDFFCISGNFFALLFPFIDGYTTTQPFPPV